MHEFKTFHLISDRQHFESDLNNVIEHCNSDNNALEFGKVLDSANVDGYVVTAFTARYHTQRGRGSQWNVVDVLSPIALVVYPNRRHRV